MVSPFLRGPLVADYAPSWARAFIWRADRRALLEIPPSHCAGTAYIWVPTLRCTVSKKLKILVRPQKKDRCD